MRITRSGPWIANDDGHPLGDACNFCGKRITRARGAFLEIFGVNEQGELLLWPAGYGVGVLTHANCGPDTGYSLELSRIREAGSDAKPFDGGGDSLAGWKAHLSSKGWWWSMPDLEAAHALAKKLPLGAKRK